MPDASSTPQRSVTVVVLTHNRREEVLRTLARLFALPERPAIVVVDNGSVDGSADAIARCFPAARLIRLDTNVGAAGRNYGVAAVRTRYVAFCDDDTYWAPGSIGCASALLDVFPNVAVVCARILVGERERVDPASERMACSPLPAAGAPGPALLGFLAGASVMRVEAFRQVGGYCRRLFLGGEEQLIALDLAARGWKMAYCEQLTVHHFPSGARDDGQRRLLLARNAAWTAWLRLPWREAWAAAMKAVLSDTVRGMRSELLWRMLIGMPWALKHRRVVPSEVQSLYRQVAEHEAGFRAGFVKKPLSPGRKRPRPVRVVPPAHAAVCALCGEALGPGYVESALCDSEVGGMREFGSAPCPCCGSAQRTPTHVR